jgi:tetratricopeptide (TPR) repeat protein
MRYKKTEKPLPQIARELGVDGIVEGSVLRVGDRVRITAQLIQAEQERHLWAESYERDLRDVLALQSEVARAIASEIKAKVTPQEQTRLARARPVNPEAHELYLKGRYSWNKRTPEALKKSLEYFEQAIKKDPSYAPAYAGLADSYNMLGAGFYAVLPPKQAYPRAEAAATKALQLDSTLAEAHTSLAWSKIFFDWDWQGGEREFTQAIELNPGYANAHHWYAVYLTIMGRHSEAIAQDRKAESLDPLSLIISADVALQALGPAGLYDQEMEQCRKTLEMDPSFPLAHACLSDSYKNKRMYKEAVAEMLKAIDLSGGSVVWVSALAQTYALAGRRDEAIKILNELKARSKQEYVSPNLFAYIYAGLGDKDQAFAWLEKAYEERSDLVGGLKVGRQLDPLRSDPRFQDLLRRMNLPP